MAELLLWSRLRRQHRDARIQQEVLHMAILRAANDVAGAMAGKRQAGGDGESFDRYFEQALAKAERKRGDQAG